MRRLRGAGGRRAAALLPGARRGLRGQAHRNGGGTRRRRGAASAAGGLRRPGRRAVRLLHAGDPHDGESTAREGSERQQGPDPGSDFGQPLPLHGLPADLRSDRGSGKEDESMNVIGKPRRRVDGRAKVTGLTKFADDIVLPRMLHCRLLRSSHPHAEIISIETAKATALPGVHLVLTGKDFPVSFGIMPVSQDEYPLANGKVRYVGDPVAAVIAIDEQTCSQALDLIEVENKLL